MARLVHPSNRRADQSAHRLTQVLSLIHATACESYAQHGYQRLLRSSWQKRSCRDHRSERWHCKTSRRGPYSASEEVLSNNIDLRRSGPKSALPDAA